MRRINFSNFAKKVGVSRTSVTYAVQRGRLKKYTDEETGKEYLLEEEAEVDWFKNADPVRMEAAKKAVEKYNAKQTVDPENMPEPVNDETAPGVPSLTISKARKEKYLAESARLNFEERIGELVKVSEVKDASFKVARTIRNNLMALPDRLAAELAAETNQFRVHKTLTDEIRRAISDVIKDLDQEGSSEP
jgi:hypothetical protein